MTQPQIGAGSQRKGVEGQVGEERGAGRQIPGPEAAAVEEAGPEVVDIERVAVQPGQKSRAGEEGPKQGQAKKQERQKRQAGMARHAAILAALQGWGTK